MRLDDEQGPSRVLSRLNDGLPKDKKSFPSLTERLEIQRDRELYIDCNEWSLPRGFGEVERFIKKPNCSVVIPANRSSTLMVNLPKDLNQWRLKDRLPDERKYVIYNHKLNALIKAPFEVVTAFPNDANPLFSSHCHSQESFTSSCNTSLSETKSKFCTKNTVSIAIQTDPEPSNFQPDTKLTSSLWKPNLLLLNSNSRIETC